MIKLEHYFKHGCLQCSSLNTKLVKVQTAKMNFTIITYANGSLKQKS